MLSTSLRTTDVGIINVIVSALLAGLAGWALLALLGRFTARARAIWTAVAVTVFVVSMLPVVTVDASAGTRSALAAMHLTVAGIVIPMFRKGARSA